MRTPSFALLLCLGLASSGCTAVVSSLLEGPVDDCQGRVDGTPCSAAELCLSGVCVYSACGDGYVDATLGEQCDDGNMIAGDGCEPGRCRFTCARDEQCLGTDPCNQGMGCNLEEHRCNQPTPLSGPSCTSDEGPGTCRMGICSPPGCGDGVVANGEDCDDQSPGCAPDCTWVCDTDKPCSTTDLCAMPMACNLGTHVCGAGTTLQCDDDDVCTAESCDPLTGCVSTVIDADHDGYSPGHCHAGSGHEGGDCDDQNPDRYPGATEMLNQLDDDCDLVVDENPGLNCLRDADGDGYGDASTTQFMPSCTAGWVGPRPVSDCHDGNAAVNPGITSPSATPYCKSGTLQGSANAGWSCSGGSAPSWDWNCSGSATPSIPDAVVSCDDLAACGGAHWAGTVPACGTRGTLRSCAQSCLLILCSCANTDTPNVAQACL